MRSFRFRSRQNYLTTRSSRLACSTARLLRRSAPRSEQEDVIASAPRQSRGSASRRSRGKFVRAVAVHVIGCKMTLRIAVIGGGIGGLTAAVALRQAGFEVDVYEQA